MKGNIGRGGSLTGRAIRIGGIENGVQSRGRRVTGEKGTKLPNGELVRKVETRKLRIGSVGKGCLHALTYEQVFDLPVY